MFHGDLDCTILNMFKYIAKNLVLDSIIYSHLTTPTSISSLIVAINIAFPEPQIIIEISNQNTNCHNFLNLEAILTMGPIL